MKQIQIKKEYFTNIEQAINSLNEFINSRFKTKNFPVYEDESQLDSTLMGIFNWLNNVDPTWVDDSSKVEEVLEKLAEATEDIQGDKYQQLVDSNNKQILDYVYAFIGFKALQLIADNYESFTEFVNAIYSFELFTKPSKFANVIETFGNKIPLDEIGDILGDNEFMLFTPEKYVEGVFNNEQIIIPEDMQMETETTRIKTGTDAVDVEVVILDEEASTEGEETPVQEAAEVNYFENDKPKHITYKDGKFVTSDQLNEIISFIMGEMENCTNVDQLVDCIKNAKFIDCPGGDRKLPTSLTDEAVAPFILTKYFNNEENGIEFTKSDKFNDYIKSYDSILEKNSGSKRFENYDILSTFKTDKKGTLKFIEDFLKLNLVNDEACIISNNTLMTIFNIFDSRIYLDLLYNILPDDKKTEEDYQTEDAFVKMIRARLNKNAQDSNPYGDKDTDAEIAEEETPTSSEIQEFVTNTLHKFGDMTISEMQQCKQFGYILKESIKCIDDIMYNKGISPMMINNYIGESFDAIEDETEVLSDNNPDNNIRIRECEDLYGYGFSDDLKSYINNSYQPSIERKTITIPMGTFTPTSIYTIDDMISLKKKDSPETKDGIPLGIDKDNNVLFLNTSDDNIYVQYNDTLPSGEKKSENIKVALTWTELSNNISKSISEQYKGEIPDYMKTRININDDMNANPEVTITPTDIQLPPDIPTNSINDLADSVDAKLESGGDMEDKLGTGYADNPNKGNDSKVVYNITNTYTNSFNKDSNNTSTNTTNTNDLSSGKTTTNNDLSSNKSTDASVRKIAKDESIKYKKADNTTGDAVTNNNNNSNKVEDTDAKSIQDADLKQTMSNGKSLQEMFMILEAEEPLSNTMATTIPKDDMMTTALDRDRKLLKTQQGAKKGVDKMISTGKALTKPVTRTRQWLAKTVDSLLQRDEDRVKSEIIENKSYRSALFKATRLALKLGLTGVAFAINGYIGAAMLGIGILRISDKQRLKKEVQSEIATELTITDEKIRACENTPEGNKQKYQLMRMRNNLQQMAINAPASTIKGRSSISY